MHVSEQQVAPVLSSSPSHSQIVHAPLVSPDEQQSYDYLARVRALADAISPELYEKAFRDTITSRPSRAFTVDADGRVSGEAGKMSWGSIASVKEQIEMLLMNQYSPQVLVIEDIDKATIQSIGPRLELSPRFLAEHLARDPCISMSNGDDWLDILDRLETAFRQSSVSETSTDNSNDTTVKPSTRSFVLARHLVLRLYYPSSQNMFEEQAAWAKGRSGRLNQRMSGQQRILLPISYSRVLANSWLILIDRAPVIPSDHLAEPFSSDHWLEHERRHTKIIPPSLADWATNEKISSPPRKRQSDNNSPYDTYSRLRELLSANERRLSSHATSGKASVIHLLFGGTSTDRRQSLDSLESIEMTIPLLLAVTTWHGNIDFLEERFNVLRHTVVSDPSRATFAPLMLLRKNISDLEQAVLRSSNSVTDFHQECLADLQQHTDKPLGTFDEIFDTLIKRSRAVAVALDHEVQMVVGSVTIQDSAIMKEDSAVMRKQARRATLLTILAAIYLPLTLVTGVFGMNISEINDGAPRFWACIIGVLVIGGATVVGVFGYWRWDRARRTKASHPVTEEAKMHKLA